jgi:hypothetical protein
LDSKLANSISYLGMGFLRTLEVFDLEARVFALEKSRRQTRAKSEKPLEESGRQLAQQLRSSIKFDGRFIAGERGT